MSTIIIGNDKDEMLDVISEISELSLRMQYAAPNRVFALMMQQKIFIDQLTGYLQRLPNNVAMVPEDADAGRDAQYDQDEPM